MIDREVWEFASTNQKPYPDLGSDASSVWNFWLVSLTSFRFSCFLRLLESLSVKQLSSWRRTANKKTKTKKGPISKAFTLRNVEE